MKSFFPDNAVEYFVSYYDYFQPEAYVARTDTYIEKDSQINETIDRMRHAATQALLERNDVIIVASVSCIYGIGSVETYAKMVVKLQTGGKIDRDSAGRRAGQSAVPPQRHRFYPRHLPPARRGRGYLSEPLRGSCLARQPVRRRDREHPGIRSADRGEDRCAGRASRSTPTATTSRPRPTLDPGDARHQDRAQGTAGRVRRRRASCWKCRAAAPAHHLRHRDDGDGRQLQRDRELFALSVRPQCRRAAADLV